MLVGIIGFPPACQQRGKDLELREPGSFRDSSSQAMERFEEWTRFVFDHAVDEPGWYWAAESEIERWTDDPERTVGWMTQLFRQHGSLAPYSHDQVGQGLWFLLGDASPGDFGRTLYDGNVDLALRLKCIAEVPSFFASYLAVHCTRLAFRHEDTGDLDVICFMWWDLWPPRWGRQSSLDSAAVDTAVLDALTAIAALPSLACVESALHGLGHMYAMHAQGVEEIIGAMLRHESGWPAELVQYAEAARRGEVQ